VIRTRRIDRQDSLYPQAVALREEEILRPLRLTMAEFHTIFPKVEEKLEHFVAVVDVLGKPRVIGSASLLPNDPVAGIGRMMQMAVHRQRQREGIGTMLVAALEKRAFGELGLKELYTHVPVPSIGFCQSLGWQIDSDEFSEAGVPHRRMIVRAPDPGDISSISEPDPEFD
jgi:N-acetylglutamate synthase-like GNAT family acetyltransferase